MHTYLQQHQIFYYSLIFRLKQNLLSCVKTLDVYNLIYMNNLLCVTGNVLQTERLPRRRAGLQEAGPGPGLHGKYSDTLLWRSLKLLVCFSHTLHTDRQTDVFVLF